MQNNIKIYSEIKKIIRFLFSEVGIIRSKLNYAVNYFIYFKHTRKISNPKIEYKYFDKNKFLKKGFTEFKYLFNFTIDEHKILNQKILNKKNGLTFKDYWGDIIFDETELKKKIANQILSTEIFDFAKEYFGKLPMLRSICCYHTPGMKKIEATSSMNWHKDLHHKKLIKIMYFVSDVFKANGPTTAINKIDSKKIKYVNYPDYFSDRDLKNQNIEIKIEELTGKKNEGYMIDTANCFHMGSRSNLDRTQMIITICPYPSNLSPFKNIDLDPSLNEFNKSLRKII